MTPATVFVSKPAKRASAVVLVDDDVAGAQVGERAQRAAAAPAGRLTAGARGAAAEQPVLRDHRESEAGRDEAVAQARLGEREVGAVRERSRRPSGP